jgi:serine/threonine-protein kinase
VTVSSSSPIPLGERFGRYVLLEQIGRGGMAEVYRAVAQGLEGFQRVFVIKRILRDRSASPEFVEMFINEARISALLNHPNIVQIYDFGQIEGSYFLTMEHLRGRDLLSSLRALRSQGKNMSPEVAAYVAQQVALGLDYAHHVVQGGKPLDIVHRDVSPSNIMLLRAGGVKLLDFGIAKAAMEIPTESQTQVGLVKGKLSYVSPEQIRGAAIDGRSDVFALGVVLWESLTGKRLFFDKNDFQTMKNVLERPVPPPSVQRADVPTVLDFIVLRALERDPAKRYPDAKAMAIELETFLQDARFAPRAMIKMLEELFGPDDHQVEAVPDVAAISIGTPVTSPEKVPVAAVGPSASLPPVPDDEEESYTGVSSVHRMAEKKRMRRMRPVWATAAAAAIVVVVVALASRSQHTPAPTEDGVPAAAMAPVPAAAPAAPVLPAVPPLPSTVSIRFESDPPGAEIKDGEGKLLGVTPLTTDLPRGTQPIAITVAKTGYAPVTQKLVPDHDQSTLLALRAQEEPRKRSSRHRRAPADSRIREGLSIDPFADDNQR